MKKLFSVLTTLALAFSIVPVATQSNDAHAGGQGLFPINSPISDERIASPYAEEYFLFSFDADASFDMRLDTVTIEFENGYLADEIILADEDGVIVDIGYVNSNDEVVFDDLDYDIYNSEDNGDFGVYVNFAGQSAGHTMDMDVFQAELVSIETTGLNDGMDLGESYPWSPIGSADIYVSDFVFDFVLDEDEVTEYAPGENVIMDLYAWTPEETELDSISVQILGTNTPYFGQMYVLDSNSNTIDAENSFSNGQKLSLTYQLQAEDLETLKFSMPSSENLPVGTEIYLKIYDVEAENNVTGDAIDSSLELPIYSSVAKFVSDEPQVAKAKLYINETSPSTSSKVIEKGQQDLTVLGFSAKALENDVAILEVDVDIDGDYDIINSISLVDENGDVLSVKSASSQVTFNENYVIEKGDTVNFKIVADISSNASAGDNFLVSINSIEAVDLDTADSVLPTGSYKHEGPLFSISGVGEISGSDYVEIKKDLGTASIVGPGDNNKAIFSFSMSVEKDIAVDRLRFYISGSGRDYIDDISLIELTYDEILDSGYLSPSGYVEFDFADYEMDANKVYDFQIEADIVSWAQDSTLSVYLKEADIISVNTADEIDVSGQLPLFDKTVKIETGDSNTEDDDSGQTNPGGTPDDEYEQFIETYENPFADISDAKAQTLEGQAALYLSAKNIIRGYITSYDPFTVEFKGHRKLNRAEAAKFIVNSLGYKEEDYCQYSTFSDIKALWAAGEDVWYDKYVCTAQSLGIISGYQDGTFGGANYVRKDEFIKMLVEAHDLPLNMAYDYDDINSGDWVAQYVGISQEMDLFPNEGENFEGHKIMTRWETAVATYKVLTSPYSKYQE